MPSIVLAELKLSDLNTGNIKAARTIDRKVFGTPWPENVWLSFLKNSNNVTVASVEEGVIGFCAVQHIDGFTRIEKIAVHQRYQGMGVGQKLLEWVEHRAVVSQSTHVVLEVRGGNERARMFYVWHNYHTVSVIPRFYRNGDLAYIYSKKVV